MRDALKKIELVAVLLAVLAIILITCLGSCRSVNKSKSSSNLQSDSSSVKKSNTGQVSKQDTAGKSFSNQVAKKETYNSDEAGFSVKFGDSSKSDKPVTWQFNEDGSVTFDPGGRPVDNLTGQSKKKSGTKDSTGSTNKQSTKAANYDSIYQNVSDSGGVNEVMITENKNVNRTPDYSWILWAVGGFVLLVLLVLGVYKLYKKFK